MRNAQARPASKAKKAANNLGKGLDEWPHFVVSLVGQAMSRGAQKRSGTEQAHWFEVNRPPAEAGIVSREDRESALPDLGLPPQFHHSVLPAPRTTWRDYAIEALQHQMKTASGHLKRLGRGGDSSAAIVLAKHSVESVQFLNSAARQDGFAKLLLPFSRRQIAWPCFKSPHRQFFQDEERLLDILQVAQGDARLIAEKLEPESNDAAGRVAMRVWQVLSAWRNEDSKIYFRPLDEWSSSAAKLPRFNSNEQAVLAWFELAKAYIKAHPDEFDDAMRAIAIPRSKRPKGGAISSHAFTMLREKFRSMAGFNKI